MVAVSVKTNPSASGKHTKISWEDFQKKYLSKEDRYKYEWVNGTVEKTPRAMDKSQFYIQYNLIQFFTRLASTTGNEGLLIAEGDTFFDGQHRRPDIAFYTKEQIFKADKKNIVPGFLIEVISGKDQMNKVHQKMDNYRAAGVAVIWHIFPLLKQVHVYTDNAGKMVVCKDDQICSAEPVIPGFKLSAGDIFKKSDNDK